MPREREVVTAVIALSRGGFLNDAVFTRVDTWTTLEEARSFLYPVDLTGVEEILK